MGGFFSQAISSVANYFSSKSASDSTNSANLRNTRLNNELQERLSRTAHQREVKDLKSAGLNPILSARGSGAPQPSSAAAKVEPKPSLTSAAINAAQIQLLHAQSRKTSAEALNTELQEPYNRALSDVYSSVLGAPAVGVKAAGGLASAYGMYKGARVVHRMIKSRKSRKSSLSASKPTSNASRGASGSRSVIRRNARRRSGLKFHERVNKSTGEIKSRWSYDEAIKKASNRTNNFLRRFGGRRFRFR